MIPPAAAWRMNWRGAEWRPGEASEEERGFRGEAVERDTVAIVEVEAMGQDG